MEREDGRTAEIFRRPFLAPRERPQRIGRTRFPTTFVPRTNPPTRMGRTHLCLGRTIALDARSSRLAVSSSHRPTRTGSSICAYQGLRLKPLYDLDLCAPAAGADRITQLLFHPSGRLLCAVDGASGLRAYAVDASSRLDLMMNIDYAGGSMAITLKDARPEDR